MKNQELHLMKEIEKLRAENLIMKKLATTSGFYQYYFENLKNHKTNLDCYNSVNELYHSHFKEYRYASYESFRKYIKNHIRK